MNGDDLARLPEGARDVLPVERSELTALERSLRTSFASFGYLEVRTPLLEFAHEMDRAQDGGVGRAFRLFDDHGRVLVLRPDLTIPVTRLVASRFADHDGPVRVSYVGARLRPALPGKAQPVEEQQAGAELVGLSGPAADAEIVALLIHAVRAVGIADLHVAIGHVGLTQAVLAGLGVPDDAVASLQAAALTRDLAGWREIAQRLDLDAPSRDLLAELPTRRGGKDLVQQIAAQVPASAQCCDELCATLDLLGTHGVDDAVMVDLGVLRDWGYYSGIVFEISAPGVPRPIGAGGRYDSLGARFGVDRPAVGGGVWLDGLHQAVNARVQAPTFREGVVLAGGLDTDIALAVRLRAAGVAVVAAPTGTDAEALATIDRWRYVVTPASGTLAVLDRSSGERVESSDVAEVIKSRA